MLYQLPDPEKDQLKDFRDGNKNIIEHFYKSFKDPLIIFIKRLITEHEQVEHIFSEAFLKLYILRSRFECINDMEAFLYVTCRNAAYDYFRAKKAKKERYAMPGFADAIPAAENNTAEIHETIAIIENTIWELPVKRRLVLQYSLLEDKTDAEIASLLNIQINSVRTTRKAALNDLRKRLLLLKHPLADAYFYALKRKTA